MIGLTLAGITFAGGQLYSNICLVQTKAETNALAVVALQISQAEILIELKHMNAQLDQLVAATE